MILAYSICQQTAVPEEEQHATVTGVSPGPGLESQSLLALAQEWIDESLGPQVKLPFGQPLSLLLATPWPIVEAIELHSYPGKVVLDVSSALKGYLELPQEHPVLARALAPPTEAGTGPTSMPRTYVFRLSPYREMVSDMVRWTKLPFCGLRPFMRMVTDIAEKAMAAGCPTSSLSNSRACEFSFVEGGPHVGDCAIWAAATLRLAGVRLRALAFEPLPDASSYFQQSVIENGFAGEITVRPAAMGSEHGSLELIYFRGHNGQACKNGADFEFGHPDEVTTVKAPKIALDDELPASWPVVDALKLSVNGGERDTIVGARKLLNSRRICSVLLHTRKCLRGRKSAADDPAPGNPSVSRFAHDIMESLEEGNMEVYTHNDGTSGPERGGVRRLKTAAELDEIFDHPELTEQFYLLARSRDEERCSFARSHFPAAANRPADGPLEDPGH